MTTTDITTGRAEGPVSAAIIAAGIGATALGLLTTLAAASKGVSTWLTFAAPVGPLSGKTIMAVIIWLISWAILHVAMRKTQFESTKALIIAVLLIALGLLGTFPLFYEAFAQ